MIEEPKKTSIHLVRKSAFAGVATRRTAIVLAFKSDRKLSSARLNKSGQASAKRFHHQAKLTLPDEVDTELLKWLKDAGALSG